MTHIFSDYDLWKLRGPDERDPTPEDEEHSWLDDLNQTFGNYPLLKDGDGYTYGPWKIVHAPKPVPAGNWDWDWTHEEYDGPEDRRIGCAGSLRECLQEITELFEENTDAR